MEHVREPSQTILRWYGDDVIDDGHLRAEAAAALTVPDGPGLGVDARPQGAEALP